jgi:hypothetical protein
LAHHPVRLVSLVFVDVSSIKMRRANALLKKRRRRVTHRSRARAISGRSCSLAVRLFFIAQPKPMEKSTDSGSMDHHTTFGQFDTQLVQRHVTIAGNTRANPIAMRHQFTATWWMTLLARRDRALQSVQDHHVVDESRRDPEVPGCFTMTIAFFHKRNHSLTQLHWMRLAHGRPLSMAK